MGDTYEDSNGKPSNLGGNVVARQYRNQLRLVVRRVLQSIAMETGQPERMLLPQFVVYFKTVQPLLSVFPVPGRYASMKLLNTRQ